MHSVHAQLTELNTWLEFNWNSRNGTKPSQIREWSNKRNISTNLTSLTYWATNTVWKRLSINWPGSYFHRVSVKVSLYSLSVNNILWISSSSYHSPNMCIAGHPEAEEALKKFADFLEKESKEGKMSPQVQRKVLGAYSFYNKKLYANDLDTD